MLAGCSEPTQDTTVVFDGQAYTITAAVHCQITRAGTLAINAGKGKELVSASLVREPRLVVQSVSFRHFDVRGFTDNPADVTAANVDDTYTLEGNMPPGEGEAAWHHFAFDVTCPQIKEYTPPRPPK